MSRYVNVGIVIPERVSENRSPGQMNDFVDGFQRGGFGRHRAKYYRYNVWGKFTKFALRREKITVNKFKI